MTDKFEEASDILKKNGIVALAKRRMEGNNFMVEVRGPVPLTRMAKVVGAALMFRQKTTAGVDPYEFYNGEQSAIYVEPGRIPELTIRSANQPMEIKKPEKGGWYRARGKVVSSAENALKNSPARFFWCEGMANEDTNLK